MRGHEFTAAEDVVLRDNFPAHGARWAMWGALLPGVGPGDIARRARALRVAHRWSDDERRALVSAMASMEERTRHTLDECVRELRRIARERRGMCDPASAEDMRAMFRQVVHTVAGTHATDFVAAQSTLACAAALMCVADEVCDLRVAIEGRGAADAQA